MPTTYAVGIRNSESAFGVRGVFAPLLISLSRFELVRPVGYELVAIPRPNFDQSDIGALLDSVGERKRSRADRCKDPRRVRAVERFVHHLAKNARPDFHWADFVNHNQLPLTDGCAERFNANRLEGEKIESILSDALRGFEIHMSK